MATFRLPVTLVRQSENANGDLLSSSQTNNQTIIIETSVDDGFFKYEAIAGRPGDETQLQAIGLSDGNITAVTVDGNRFEGAAIDDLSFFSTRIRNDGQTIDLISVELDSGPRSTDSFFIVLNGATFPDVGSVPKLESFVASASFSDLNTGPFRPGVRIDLEDIPGAQFTPTPIELGEDAEFGTDGPDVLEGTPEPDGIDGLGGNDLITGLSGGDTIFGSAGNDTITGGGGRDVILGGSGRDELSGNGGADRLDGEGGGDLLIGGGGKDTLNAGGGRDMLEGGGGKDALDGGGGRDMLEGGRGKDELTGGGGRDFFVFSTGDGRDRITDFRDRKDRIMIEDGAEAFADLTIVQFGDDARVRFSNVTIDIEDTDISALSAADFIFS